VRTAPLYEQAPAATIEAVHGLPLHPGCRLCPRHASARNVCLSPDGAPGGLYVVGAYPGVEEDRSGRVFAGQGSRRFRDLVAQWWPGPVMYDNALRCQDVDAAKATILPSADKCRPYLAKAIADAKPTRILLLGEVGAYGVLGRKVEPFSARRAFTYLASGVPVFMVTHPAAAARNRFVRAWHERDLQWALQVAAPPWEPAWAGKVYHDVETPEDAAQAVAALRAYAPPARPVASETPQAALTFDCETRGRLYDASFAVVSISIGTPDDLYVWDRAALEDPATRASALALLADPAVLKGGTNVKGDIQMIWCAYGVEVHGIAFDAQLMTHVIDPDADGYLAAMAEVVGCGGHKQEAEAAKDEAKARAKRWDKERFQANLFGGVDQIDEVAARGIVDQDGPSDRWVYALLPPPVRKRYVSRDVLATARLGVHLDRRLAREPAGLQQAWRESVLPAIQTCVQVEKWGVPVDIGALRAADAHFARLQEQAEVKLKHYKFNPASPPQIAAFLYDELKLSVPEEFGRSTAAEALAAIKGKHPVIADLLHWRRIDKLRDTYTLGWLRELRGDGRLHPTIKIDGARTGRFSAVEPNIQNVVSEKGDGLKAEWGTLLKGCIKAPPGYVLFSVDLSQIELRIAADLSGDELMREIYRKGLDYHQRTAELIAPLVWPGLAPHEVGKNQRRVAKEVNFGVFYRQGAASLAEKLHTTQTEAQRILDAVLGAFKTFTAWRDAKIRETQRTGCMWTHWHEQEYRRRWLWRIAEAGDDDEAGRNRSTAETGAFNGDIQGTANEVCMRAMIEVVRWIREEGVDAKICAPIHDQLLGQVRERELDEVLAATVERMESYKCSVPIVAEPEVGYSWSSLEKYGKPRLVA